MKIILGEDAIEGPIKCLGAMLVKEPGSKRAVFQVAFEMESEGNDAVIRALCHRVDKQYWFYAKFQHMTNADVRAYSEAARLSDLIAKDPLGTGTNGKLPEIKEGDSHYSGG